MSSPILDTTYRQLVTGGAPGLSVSYGTYNSVKLQTQQVAFLVKEFLCNNLAESAYYDGVKLANPWTMHWSSDGTTGPTGDNDHTDRITDHTKFATRADSDSSAVSYYVLKSGTQTRASWQASTPYERGEIVTNGGHLYTCHAAGTSASSGGPTTTSLGQISDGSVEWEWLGAGDGYVYLCVAFRTAQDYYLSITFASKYARAGTATYFPTAVANQSVVVTPGGTHQSWLAGSDSSADRVLHISARDDGTGFTVAVARSADIPNNGGCVVLGRIEREYLDGTDGSWAVALPVFLWTASGVALKGNSAMGAQNIYGYHASSNVGAVLFGIPRAYARQNYRNSGLMLPIMTINGANTVTTVYNDTTYLCNKRRAVLGGRFQSMPLTHICGAANDRFNAVWGTITDMHTAAPFKSGPVGMTFGDRWWLFGVFMIPNPSGAAPAVS